MASSLLYSAMDNLSINDSFQYLRAHRDGHLNIVAIGKTGEGKSATINSMIFHSKDPKPNFFKEEESHHSVTKAFNECTVNLFGLNCRLIDTIGLFDTELTPERKAELQFLKIPDLEEDHKSVLKNLANIIALCSEGIDAFLLVVDGTSRMASETKETINVIQRFLGVAMLDHCIFVLTKADRVENGPLEKMEKSISQYLNDIGYFDIDNRFVHFDNKHRPQENVTKLLKVIEENLQKQNGYPYSIVAFHHAQNVFVKVKQNLHAAAVAENIHVEYNKQNAKETDKEKQKLYAEMEAKLDRFLTRITEQSHAQPNKQLRVIQDQLDEKVRQIMNLQTELVEERKHAQTVLAEEKQKRHVEMDAELQRHGAAVTEKVRVEYDKQMKVIQDQLNEKDRQISNLQEENKQLKILNEDMKRLIESQYIGAISKSIKQSHDSAYAPNYLSPMNVGMIKQMEDTLHSREIMIEERNKQIKTLSEDIKRLTEQPPKVVRYGEEPEEETSVLEVAGSLKKYFKNIGTSKNKNRP